MKTYDIIQTCEVSYRMEVRAPNAAEANEKATERFGRLLDSVCRTRKGLHHGDVNDNYVPARDDEGETA